MRRLFCPSGAVRPIDPPFCPSGRRVPVGLPCPTARTPPKYPSFLRRPLYVGSMYPPAPPVKPPPARTEVAARRQRLRTLDGRVSRFFCGCMERPGASPCIHLSPHEGMCSRFSHCSHIPRSSGPPPLTGNHSVVRRDREIPAIDRPSAPRIEVPFRTRCASSGTQS